MSRARLKQMHAAVRFDTNLARMSDPRVVFRWGYLPWPQGD